MRALMIFALLLTGCAASRTIYTQDGRPGYAINCSGWALSWDQCFAKAGQMCGTAGYDVFDKNGERVWAGFTPVTNRSMVIACGHTSAPAP